VPRADVENKAKVYMDEVSFITDQDVPIMAVFYLKYVADHTVCGLALDEVLSRDLIVDCVRQSEFVDEVFVERAPVSFAHLVTADGVGDDFNDASHIEHLAGTVRDSLIRKHIEVEPDAIKDALEHLDNL
jgi:hypothetical protein